MTGGGGGRGGRSRGSKEGRVNVGIITNEKKRNGKDKWPSGWK